ncbi:FolC bifunctional protein [Atractiella rhizophila]|nr:FolC bifunctional protein [Atractiella rhizophila]
MHLFRKMSTIPIPAISLTLSRVSSLLSSLSQPNPQDLIPTIHITGTNGKGSVSSFLDSILRASGFRTGRFNSPHLLVPRDSIRINGEPISQILYDRERMAVIEEDKKLGTQASEFELLTATAFRIFASNTSDGENAGAVDIGIIEVGMGGEGDATNVISSPLVSVFTSIDMDHQAFLGNSIADIATVKSGIIKRLRPVVLGRQRSTDAEEVVKMKAEKMGSSLHRAGVGRIVPGAEEKNICEIPLHSSETKWIQASVPLLGTHQLENVSTALTTIEVLRNSCSTLVPRLNAITNESIVRGIEGTTWPGRLSWHSHPFIPDRRVLLDGAHNPSSMSSLRAYISSLPKSRFPQLTLILSLSHPRRPSVLLDPPFDRPTKVLCVEFQQPDGMPWVKALDRAEMKKEVEGMGMQAVECKDMAEALTLAGKEQEELVVVAGSLYGVADAIRVLEKAEPR